jgi:hypothetical protein
MIGSSELANVIQVTRSANLKSHCFQASSMAWVSISMNLREGNLRLDLPSRVSRDLCFVGFVEGLCQMDDFQR